MGNPRSMLNGLDPGQIVDRLVFENRLADSEMPVQQG